MTNAPFKSSLHLNAATGDITGANIPAWAVTATHNFLSQSITENTPLTTAGLATPGVENYIKEYLDFDYNILLPKAGSTSHFVSPNQPIFTFSKPTRVVMIIPTTTVLANIDVAAIDQPLITAGWVYSIPKNSIAANNDALTHRITNSPADYLYERVFPAGTHNLDPTALAPLAFYLFEEKSFDDQVFTNTTNIATSIFNITANTGLLSATAGVATGGKALIVHPQGFIIAKPQFYQTQNTYNNGSNDLPFDNYPGLNAGSGPPYSPPGTIAQAPKLFNNGLARLAADWKQYTSWANNIQTKNSDPDTFENVLTYGVKVKQSGYYKVTCHMQFKSTIADTAVAIRFALHRPGDVDTLVDDENDAPLNYSENPSPCQVSDVICQGDKTAGSVNLSHVIQLAVDDEVSVYTSGAGVFGEVKTAPSTCVFRVEYMGPAVWD